MHKLYVKYVKLYDQDNCVSNLVTVVVKYAFSPGRWLKGWMRVSKEMFDNRLRVNSFGDLSEYGSEMDMIQLIYDKIIYMHYGKSIKMVRRLKKLVPLI